MKFLSGLLVTSKAKQEDIIEQMDFRYKRLKLNKFIEDESGIHFLIFTPKNIELDCKFKSFIHIVDEKNPFILAKDECEKKYEELSKEDEVKFTDGINIMSKEDYINILSAFIKKTETFNKTMESHLEEEREEEKERSKRSNG